MRWKGDNIKSLSKENYQHLNGVGFVDKEDYYPVHKQLMKKYKHQLVENYFVLNQASKILSTLVGNCDTLGMLMKNIYMMNI